MLLVVFIIGSLDRGWATATATEAEAASFGLVVELAQITPAIGA